MLIRLRSAVPVEDLLMFFTKQKFYYANLLLRADEKDVPKLQGAGVFLEDLMVILQDAPKMLEKLETTRKGNT